jgi:alpha-maltose-1-phosphate synthase
VRIFYIAHFDCTRDAGHAARVRGSLGSLERQGHEIWLFSSGWRPPETSRIHFVPIPQVRVPGLYVISFVLCCWLPLLWHTLAHRPELVYSVYFKLVLLLTWIARLRRVPFIVEVNAELESERLASGQGRLQRSIESRLEGWTYRWVQGIVVVAPGIAESIRSRFRGLRKTIAVVPNGVDLETFSVQDALACRQQLGLAQEDHYVTFVGAFQRWQGLPTLIRAAQQVVAALPNTKFLLVGDGPERKPVEVLIRELGLQRQIVLAGWCSPEKSARYIGASDVCVAPYNALGSALAQNLGFGASMRGSPMKIYTYLACGRPVIATHFREAGALVQDLGAGLAVPPEDESALGESILTLLRDPDRAQRMGAIARQTVCREYSWDAVMCEIAKYLQQISIERTS